VVPVPTHFCLGPKPGELKEITPGGDLTEEFKCAQHLDGLAEVEFWVRNLSRRNTSFRLQTSKDWFYPDFLCQLTDGRILAGCASSSRPSISAFLLSEFQPFPRGKHLYDAADADEKRNVGAVWQSRSDGKCIFVMPTEGDFSVITEAPKPG
jgi:type III restriction enzyme